MAEGNVAEQGSSILIPWEMDPAQGKAASINKQEHPEEFVMFPSPQCLNSPGSTRCRSERSEKSCAGAGKGKGRTDETRKTKIPVPVSLASP